MIIEYLLTLLSLKCELNKPSMSKYVIIFLSLFFVQYQIFGQDYDHLMFDRITLDDGLASNEIRNIDQDELGRIWISTSNGVSIYDGVTIKNLGRKELDGGFSFIWDVIDDKNGKIFISTGNGIVVHDQLKETYKHFSVTGHPLDVFVISQNFYLDKEKNLWMGVSKGIVRLEYDADTVIFHHQYAKLLSGERSVLMGSVLDIQEDKHGNLWLSGNDKLYVKSPTQQDFVELDDSEIGDIDGLMLNNDNQLILSGERGIYELQGGASGRDFGFRRFISADDIGGFSLGRVAGMVQDDLGNYWLKSGEKSITVLEDMGGGKWELHDIQSDWYQPNSLSTTFSNTMFVDKEGVVWIGSFNHGINKCYIKKNKFSNILPETSADEKGVDGRVVFSILKDDSDKIWFIPKDAPVHIYDFDGQTMSKLPEGLLPQTAWNLNSMWQEDNKLYVTGEWTTAGLFEITLPANYLNNRNRKDYKVTEYFKSEGYEYVRSRGFKIMRDSKGRLWYACHGGLFLMMEGANGLESKEVLDQQGKSFGSIKSILEDSNGGLWLALDNGFVWYDFDAKKVKRYDDGMGDFSHGGSITFFYEQGQYLWIGQTNTGLHQFDKKTNKIINRYDVDSGFPTDHVRSMSIDSQGDLWVGTGRGLVKFQPKSGEMRIFDKEDGLASLEFKVGNAISFSDRLVFTSNHGLVVVYPDYIQDLEKYEPTVYFTDLHVNDSINHASSQSNSILTKAIGYTNELVLKHKQNNFRVDFACDSYSIPLDIQYAYRLTGFNDEWRYTDAKTSSAEYTNIPAGSYKFEIKASNVDGVWSDQVTTLQISVLPAWWATLWFRAICIVLFVFAIYRLFRWREKQAKREKEYLKSKIEKATEEVKEQNDELKVQQGFLVEAIADTNYVIKEAVESGNFKARIDLGNKQGAWRSLGESINQLFESILTPFNVINHVVNRMAEGDLTERFEVEAKGDVLRLKDNLNVAVDNLAQLLRDISGQVEVIGQSSKAMAVTSDEMNYSTAEIASSISEMSRGAQNQLMKADQSSALIEGVLRFSNEMGEQAEMINATANEGVIKSTSGKELVGKLSHTMDALQQTSVSTTASIESLTKRSNEISRVLTIMQEIAAQTNLLALNAAIEAAQAGDSGRGFAVVAEEIRKLAEESKRSTKEIEKLIADVQQDTKTTANMIQEMVSSVAEGRADAKQGSEAFQEIAMSYSKTFELSQKIVEATKQQTEEVGNVMNIIEGVVVIAEQTAAGTEEAASSATELSSGMVNYAEKSKDVSAIVSDLQEKVSKFRLSRK